MSYNTSISILDRSSGVIGNELNESTPQIKFESGLPFMISFAMGTEMFAEIIQNIQIPSMLKTYTSNKLDKKIPYGNLTENDMCAMVTEVNTIENNSKNWWYDTGATTHICIDKDMFSTYQKCNDKQRLLMSNTGSSVIEGCGEVKLALTFGQEIILINVKYVPDMRKNLISGSLLSKAGFVVTFESDKFVLKKNDIFLGKGFVEDGLVKMCIKTVLFTNEPNAYLVEPFKVWHERLGHVNYKYVQRLINLNLIPKCKLSKEKCEVCVQAKLTKTPFPHVERTTEPLGLIHTDLCDLKFVQTRNGKKIFCDFHR
ncbi:BnaCnng30200D [Brassica napus]|uniref:BnaCnng30200D protein n=2 Tax=Brassica TaxID=3705 RepID=A0A078J2J0_BRANA|nr:BnaCnng30200D [Brassica napus]VDC93840.1 unnamed protein product [Brassica oleracea]